MLNRTEIGAFEAAVRLGDIEPVARVFQECGNTPPVARWIAAGDPLPFPQLSFLLDYWDRHRDDRGRLPRSLVEPFALRPALGFIMLLEAVDDGWDYVYRLYGSGISQYAMRDYTGLRTSELIVPGHTYIQSFYIASYRASAARGLPFYTENTPPPAIAVERWHRLVIPVADAKGQTTQFLVGNVPGSWRSPV